MWWLISLFACLLAGIAHAQPGLSAPVPLVQPGGAIISPWLNDGATTTVDGGVTRYVSPGGSTSNNCTSISAPCSLARSKQVRQGGDNILYQCNTVFSGTPAIHQAPAGTADDWSIHGAYGDCHLGRPYFQGGGESQNIDGTNRHHIMVDRLRFVDLDAIRMRDGANNLTWHLVSLENSRRVCFNISRGPLKRADPHHITIARSNIDGCGTFNLPCSDPALGNEGIYLGSSAAGESGQSDILTYNNRISRTSKEPINIKSFTTNAFFLYNRIQNVDFCNDAGIINFSGFTNINNLQVLGNVISDVQKFYGSASVFSIGPGAVIENNYIWNVTNGMALYEFSTNANGTSWFRHNTARNIAKLQHSGHVSGEGNAAKIVRNLMPAGGPSGNVTVNDAYLEGPTTGDFRLKSTATAAIDQYTTSLAAGSDPGTIQDISGAFRPTAGPWDAGAREFDAGSPPPPPSDDYYVGTAGSDSNDGKTTSTRFRTIQKCHDVVKATGAPGGKDCWVDGGVYAENITLTAIAPGRDSMFRILPEPGETVTIRPAGGVHAMDITDNAANIQIGDNAGTVIIDGDNVSNTCVIVRGWQGPTGSSADNIVFRRVTFRNSEGACVWQEAGTRGNEFRASTFENCGTHALSVRAPDNIVAASTFQNSGGIAVWLVADGNSIPTDFRLRDSIIRGHASASAILIQSGKRVLLYNNLVYESGTGLQLSGTDLEEIEVYYNTFADGLGYGIFDDSTKFSTIANNAVHGNAFGQIRIVDRADLDVNLFTNLEIDPLFFDRANDNYRLTPTSPALNAGTCIANIPFDRTGAARPDEQTGLCDIGAYEGFVGEISGARFGGGSFTGGSYQ